MSDDTRFPHQRTDIYQAAMQLVTRVKDANIKQLLREVNRARNLPRARPRAFEVLLAHPRAGVRQPLAHREERAHTGTLGLVP